MRDINIGGAKYHVAIGPQCGCGRGYIPSLARIVKYYSSSKNSINEIHQNSSAFSIYSMSSAILYIAITRISMILVNGKQKAVIESSLRA